MTAPARKQKGAGRGVLALVLVGINVVLIGLNLNKHDVGPFSGGTDDAASVDSGSPGTSDVAVGDSSTGPDAPAGPETETETETEGGSAVEQVDDWPGGHGPVPEGPPIPRVASLGADGRLTLTGSAPNWATALQVGNFAGANLPGGVEAVDNQLTWHPDASAEPQAGVVGLGQAATFPVGEAVIDEASFPALDLAAQILQSRPSLFAVVIGHTDDVGDADTNAQLALDRADAVVAYLVGKGVVPDQMVVASAGEDDPLASNETAEGRTENRRIELQFKNFLIPPQDLGLSE